MKKTMQIQKLREHDLELFYKHAKKENWDIEDIHIRASLKTHPNDFFIFYKNSQLIGFVVALKENEEFAFISSLLVLKEFRGIGYGKEIFLLALEHLKACQVALDSVLGQEPFYEKFGFKSYFDIDTLVFKTGQMSPKNNTIEVVDFDKKLSLKGQSEYLKTLLLEKGVHYKAIKDDLNSFAFAFAYKDGYKVFINTQDINHAITLFFSLCQNYESGTFIYMQSSPQEPMLQALSQALSMTKVSHFTRMYNKIL